MTPEMRVAAFHREPAPAEPGLMGNTSSKRFSGYRLEPGSGRLWSGEVEIRLTPKAAAVLGVLVARAGEPVSKAEIFDAVWRETAVTDDALTSCIQELRRAFKDDPKDPRFIETRHRRGYRFIAPLTESVDTPAPEAPATHRWPPAPEIPSPPERHAERPGDQVPSGLPAAVAVLPFADMSPGRDQDYLCEGLAEELITALTHVDGLRVAARTASFQFKGSGADVPSVGRQLGVGFLLEGSVRKAGDRLRVNVQLLDVTSGYHLWSQRFERTLDDVFAIQDEIAASVVASLRVGPLSVTERQGLQRPHTAVEAYECYLRGRQLLPRMTRRELERGGALFEQALALDRGYAPAWAGLATVHATLYEWFGAGQDSLRRAEEASEQALTLGPQQAESQVARGFVHSLSGRYDEAARAFEQAIALNANLFDAYYYYARSQFARGDIASSAELFRWAGEVRPEDFQSPMLLSQSLRILGRPSESVAAGQEGIRRAEQALALNPRDGRALSLGAGALFHDGQLERAIAWAERAIALNPDDMSALINGACLYGKLRRKHEALALLERAFAKGWGKRDWIAHDPDYDCLRDDPRFQALLTRLS